MRGRAQERRSERGSERKRVRVNLDDDCLERRVRLNGLYDLYAPLLTERQRDVYEMYGFSDLSLAEIAENLGITRQAVHIFVNRTAGRLLALEKALSFSERLKRLEDKIRELDSQAKE
jgi:predicted DNA-binding protein YlxM (UPF0122 family)